MRTDCFRPWVFLPFKFISTLHFLTGTHSDLGNILCSIHGFKLLVQSGLLIYSFSTEVLGTQARRAPCYMLGMEREDVVSALNSCSICPPHTSKIISNQKKEEKEKQLCSSLLSAWGWWTVLREQGLILILITELLEGCVDNNVIMGSRHPNANTPAHIFQEQSCPGDVSHISSSARLHPIQ